MTKEEKIRFLSHYEGNVTVGKDGSVCLESVNHIVDRYADGTVWRGVDQKCRACFPAGSGGFDIDCRDRGCGIPVELSVPELREAMDSYFFREKKDVQMTLFSC